MRRQICIDCINYKIKILQFHKYNCNATYMPETFMFYPKQFTNQCKMFRNLTKVTRLLFWQAYKLDIIK